jgi:hypothetical protein
MMVASFVRFRKTWGDGRNMSSRNLLVAFSLKVGVGEEQLSTQATPHSLVVLVERQSVPPMTRLISEASRFLTGKPNALVDTIDPDDAAFHL